MRLAGKQAEATLCKPLTGGPNKVVVEKEASDSSELRFGLWPDRNSIILENDYPNSPDNDVSVSVTDANGTQIFATKGFYLYASNEAEYLKCVDTAIKASKAAKGLRITITDTHAGFYDWKECKGVNWAAFGSGKLHCEAISKSK